MRQSSSNTLKTVSDVAGEAGVSRGSIYNWIERGDIAHSQFVGSAPVFNADEFKKAVAAAKERKRAIDVLYGK